MQSLNNHFLSFKTKICLDFWQVLPINSPNTNIDVKNEENLSSGRFHNLHSKTKHSLPSLYRNLANCVETKLIMSYNY